MEKVTIKVVEIEANDCSDCIFQDIGSCGDVFRLLGFDDCNCKIFIKEN